MIVCLKVNSLLMAIMHLPGLTEMKPVVGFRYKSEKI